MANKRQLKKSINQICEALFAECVAISLYGAESQKTNAEELIFVIVKMQDHYISRVSNPEPGISTKAYYKDLKDKFYNQVQELVDQINS